MSKKELDPEEKAERIKAIEYWNNIAKPYLLKKQRKGYKTDSSSRSSQEILDELYEYRSMWNKAEKEHKKGIIDGPEKHRITNKLYRKIKLLEKELRKLRI